MASSAITVKAQTKPLRASRDSRPRSALAKLRPQRLSPAPPPILFSAPPLHGSRPAPGLLSLLSRSAPVLLPTVATRAVARKRDPSINPINPHPINPHRG